MLFRSMGWRKKIITQSKSAKFVKLSTAFFVTNYSLFFRRAVVPNRQPLLFQCAKTRTPLAGPSFTSHLRADSVAQAVADGLCFTFRGPWPQWNTSMADYAVRRRPAVACPHLFVGTNEAIGRTKAHSRSTQPLKLQYFRNGRSFFGYHFRKSSRSRETPRIHSFDSGANAASAGKSINLRRKSKQQVRFPFVGLEARRIRDATGVAN